jgi:hypothetical protein
MNVGAFSDSRAEAKKLLKKCSLFKSDGNGSSVDPSVLKLAMGDDYVKAYQAALDALAFDFLLMDDSFFQFSWEEQGDSFRVRYAFYESPFEVIDYESYLARYELEIGEAGGMFLDDYSQEVSQGVPKRCVCPLRYDFSGAEYTPGVHSASHLHVGHGNQLRINSRDVITPALFTAFAVKAAFFERWKTSALAVESVATRLLRKRQCRSVPKKFFADIDKADLYLV